MARMMLFATSSGASGVVQATDLKVSALGVPGASVTIAPGAAIMASRYAGVVGQSYAARNDGAVSLSIPATGSSGGRTDYICLRIDDWHYDSSQQPGDPLAAAYCSFVRTQNLNFTSPYVPLAKIEIPANTATITPSMIKDLRSVALPRTKRVLRANAVVLSETETLKSATGEYFPNAGGTQMVDIPSWATRVKIRADWSGVFMSSGDCRGRVWVSFGDWTGTSWGTAATTSQEYAFDNAQGANPYRTNLAVFDDLYIPSSLRGREVHFQLWGKSLGSVGPKLDQATGVSLDLLFEEIADPSDS